MASFAEAAANIKRFGQEVSAARAAELSDPNFNTKSRGAVNMDIGAMLAKAAASEAAKQGIELDGSKARGADDKKVTADITDPMQRALAQARGELPGPASTRSGAGLDGVAGPERGGEDLSR